MVKTTKLKKQLKSNTKFAFNILTIMFASVAGWAFYNIINKYSEDTLLKFGIINIYYQNSIIITIALLFFILFGYGLKKSVEKIVGK